MTLFSTSNIRKATLALSLCSGAFLFSHTALMAEGTIDIIPDETIDGSVELTPGYIEGTIDIGGQDISRIDILAQNTEYSAKIYPTSEGPYTLTVNVPEDGSLDYTVGGTIWMDSWQTRMFLKDREVNVNEGETSPLDIIINSGYVSGEIITNGCTLSKTELWAIRIDESAHSHATAKIGSASQFRFPVQPNSEIKVYGQVQLSTGATINLDNQFITILPGQDTNVNWELNCSSGQLSNINHVVDYHMDVDYHYSHLYNHGSWTPYKSVKHEGITPFENLAPDTWRLYTYTYWNNGQNLIGKNFPNIQTHPGETTDVIFDQYPGFLSGKINLIGTHTIEDTNYAHVYSYGQNSLYPSNQAFSRALATNIDGSFRLALPHGEYSTYVSAYSFYNPVAGNDYLNSYLYMYDYSKQKDLLFINPGETIESHDITYETGSAVIKFSRPDGGPFTAPYIEAKCYNHNDTGQLDSYIYSSSRGMTTDDKVTMIGFPGKYVVDAWAYVEGSLTTFGKVEIEIIPGVEKIIDIGGPLLIVENPVANSTFTENQIIVSGTATDESGIESITINGVAVEYTSTNNLEDPYEVTFSIEIVLDEGENNIITLATDLSGNDSSEARTVTYTPPVPQIVEVLLDIKPGSCKNPFNVKSKGVLPLVLLGSENFSVDTIDVDSILLEGIAPLRSVIDDVAAIEDEGVCDTDHSDGLEDLSLKFDSQNLVQVLGNVEDGEVITLTLSGLTLDGEEIETSDIITIIKRGKKR